MGISVTQTPVAFVLSLTSSWQVADVHNALAAPGVLSNDALVFDLSQAKVVTEIERLLIEWHVKFLAFVVRDDRMAEAISQYQRHARSNVRACESIPEALRWIEHMQQDRPTQLPTVPVARPHKPTPHRSVIVPWPTRLCSREILASAVAVLRALQSEESVGDPAAEVRSPGISEHFDAFERYAGILPADVRNVLALTTGFWCRSGMLRLDFVSRSPDVLEFSGERMLVVNGETEGLVLQVHPEVCRLWWIEHDGLSLTLLERGVDAWVVRCATLALRQRDDEHCTDAARSMGLQIHPAPPLNAVRSENSLESQPVVDVRSTVPVNSPAHAWLISLPDTARIFDFRQAAPGTQVSGLWSDGEWSCHGELWAVT